MECPFCGHRRTEVYNSRNTSSAKKVWRRRRCYSCNQAFTTYEAADLSFITIHKQDGSKQPYIRSKLLISIYFACQGLLEGQLEDIDAIVDTIEAKLADMRQVELGTEVVAEATIATLKHFHLGAYMRYLSYRDNLNNTAQLREIAHNLD